MANSNIIAEEQHKHLLKFLIGLPLCLLIGALAKPVSAQEFLFTDGRVASGWTVTGTGAHRSCDDPSDAEGAFSCVLVDELDNGTPDPNSVGSAEIINGSIGSADLAPNSVGSSEIANSAVGASEIADGSVGSSEIGNNAVGASELADNSVDSAAIQTGAVGSSEIADGTIGAAEIDADAVGADELADDAVDTASIQNRAVTNDKIEDGAVSSAKIENGTVLVEDLSAGVIDEIDEKDTAILTAANTSADDGDAETLQTANAHADEGDARTLKFANRYTDEIGERTYQRSKAYTDQQVGALRRDMNTLGDTLSDGIAIALAAKIPALENGAYNALSVGLGNYNGSTALSVGGALRLDTNVVAYATLGIANRTQKLGTSLGVMWSW